MGWLDDIGKAAEGWWNGAKQEVTGTYDNVASHARQVVDDAGQTVGDIASGNFGAAGQDLNKTFGNFAGAAWDIGTLPIREGWHAFAGFGSLDQAAYKDLVSRPLTTAELAWNKAAWDGKVNDLVNGDTWRTAWKNAQYISPGQASEGGPSSPLSFNSLVMGPVGSFGLPAAQMLMGIPNQQNHDILGGPQRVDPNNPAGYQALAKTDKWGTGAIDFATSFELDPASKILKPVSAGTRALKVAGQLGALAERSSEIAPTAEKAIGEADNSTKPLAWAGKFGPSQWQKFIAGQRQAGSFASGLQAGTVSRALEAMDKFRQDPTKLTSLSWLRANGVPTGQIAGIIMNSDRNMDPLVLRTLLGDTSALNAIRAQRADTAMQIVEAQTRRNMALQAALEGNGVPSDVATKLAGKGTIPDTLEAWKQATKGYNLPSAVVDALALARPALDEHVAQTQRNLNDLNRESGWLDGVISNANALTQRGLGGSLASRLRDPLTQAIRSAQMKGLADYAQLRDHPIMYSFFHTPLTMLTAAQDLRIPEVMNFNDERSWEQVRSNLMNVRSLTADEKNALLGHYLQATTPAARADAWQRIETEATDSIAREKQGLSGDAVSAILDEYRAQKGIEAATRMRTRYSHDVTEPGQSASDLVDLDGSGHLVHAPIYASQLDNSTHVLNLRHFERFMSDYSGILGRMWKGSENTRTFLVAAQHALQQGLWKSTILLRPASGLRAVGDESVRTLAHIGAMAFGQDFLKGSSNMLKNFLYSRGKLNITDVPGMERVDADLSYAQGVLSHMYRLKDEEVASGLNPGTLIQPDQIASQEEEVRGLMKAQSEGQVFRNLPPVKGAKPFKLGREQISIGGRTWNGAFGGAGNDVYEKITGTDKLWDRHLGTVKNNIYNQFAKRALKSPTEFRTVLPTEAQHSALWQDVVNKQLLNDPVAQKIIFNGADRAGIRAWLTRTPDGQAYVRGMPRFQADLDGAIDAMFNDVAHVLPGDSLDKVIAKGKLTQDAVDSIPEAARPPITASALITSEHNQQFWGMLKAVTDKWFHNMMEMPVERLAYHPAFNSLYRSHLSDIVNAHAGEAVSVRDQLLYEQMARKRALIDMKRIHYDSAYRSKLADHLSWLSPFFAPFQSQLSGWMHVIADKPHVLSRLNQAWNAPDKAFPVVDQRTGLPADDTTPPGERAIRAQIPSSLARVLGLGNTTQLTIPKTMLSPVILSGGQGPLISPGLGPLVDIPVSTIVGANPQLENSKFINTILPMGTQDSISKAVMPTWIGTLQDALGDDKKFSQTALADYVQQEYEYKSGIRHDAPSWTEARTKARIMLAADAFAKFASPVNALPQSKWSFFADQAKVMEAADAQRRAQVAQQMQGVDPSSPQYELLKEQLQSGWQAQFLQKYGQAAFVYTTSLMQNTSGIPATLQGLAESKQFGPLLAKYPDLGGLLVHPDSGSFSSSAYQYEVQNGMRTQLTPEEAVTQNSIELGWAQYGMLRTYLDSQAQQAGYQTATQVPEYKAMLQQFTQLASNPKSQYYNPDWYNAFESYSPTKVYGQIAEMTDLFLNNPNLANDPQRPDLIATQQYLEMRDQYRLAMQQEGSKSIMSSGYLPQWDAFVAGLLQQYPSFSYVFNRYFSKDKLEG